MYGVSFDVTPEIMDSNYYIPIGKCKI